MKKMPFLSAMICLPASKLQAMGSVELSCLLSGQGNVAVGKLQQPFEEYRITK
jgi:hypothetical protein